MPESIVKTFPRPCTFAGKPVSDFEVREPTVKDIMAAEDDANPQLAPMAYNLALACQTLVRIGSYTGPFAAKQFDSMHPANFYALRKALGEVSELGEDVPAPQLAAS